ncbi:MAG: hypothetical protein BAJALOKI2v1_720006 [Promethearchaeota archaeon]|nr:MAG: hypothetical protein BAJALOKI2v1_720006 [Candidatus Lokiarchaeota archaeon]
MKFYIKNDKIAYLSIKNLTIPGIIGIFVGIPFLFMTTFLGLWAILLAVSLFIIFFISVGYKKVLLIDNTLNFVSLRNNLYGKAIRKKDWNKTDVKNLKPITERGYRYNYQNEDYSEGTVFNLYLMLNSDEKIQIAQFDKQDAVPKNSINNFNLFLDGKNITPGKY